MDRQKVALEFDKGSTLNDIKFSIFVTKDPEE